LQLPTLILTIDRLGKAYCEATNPNTNVATTPHRKFTMEDNCLEVDFTVKLKKELQINHSILLKTIILNISKSVLSFSYAHRSLNTGNLLKS
jgi:hypothetical protein